MHQRHPLVVVQAKRKVPTFHIVQTQSVNIENLDHFLMERGMMQLKGHKFACLSAYLKYFD